MTSRALLTSVASLSVVIALAGYAPAYAEDAVDAAPVVGEETLTGTWGGARPMLHNRGLDFTATEILEILGNPSGGSTKGATVQGRFDMGIDADFEKMFGATGLTGHVNAYQLHGRGMSASNLNDNIMTASGIEAESTSRLFTLWLQQNLFDDNLSIRAGQLAADDEFMTSDYGALFVNSTFGWPSSLAANLPGGGPAFPLAAPGVRVKIGQTDPWSFQVGVFDGDPTGGGENARGTNFNMDKGVLSIGELAYGVKADKESTALPATYKVGIWHHTENFADQRFDVNGVSLADSSSTGVGHTHRGDYGVYGVVDQMLWRKAGTDDQGLGGFARALWNPEDRNMVAYQLDAGLNYKGLIPNRDEDVLGVGFSYVRISDQARDLDRDANAINGTSAPVRDYESAIEITYQAPITPWLSVQPDLQYIMHPGGNVADPKDASGTSAVGDALVVGLRLTANF